MTNDNMNEDRNREQAVLPTANSGSDDASTGVSSKMQTVKAAWDKAPEGTKKTEAHKHYQSAETAQKSGNDAEALRELEAATRALD